MQKLLTLTCLFLAAYFSHLHAQTYKGIWMVNGKLETNTYTLNGSPTTILHLQPELALNFSESWMAGASLSIDFANKIARVGHGLFVRHTFIRANKNEIFAHAFFEHSSQRYLQGGGNSKYTTTTIGPGFGLLHFFNSAVALEAKMDYNLFQKTRSQFNSNKRNANFVLNFGLQYFFDSKLKADSVKWNYNINKGDWVIGGTATFGYKPNSNPDFNFTSSNILQPFAAYFITSHILLGSGFNTGNDASFQRILLGLSPFSRYYIKVARKHQFFGELKFSYNFIWQNSGEQYKRFPYSYAISPGLGYSTWILPEVSFDITFSIDNNALYDQILDEWFKAKQFNLNVGLTAFLRK